MITTTSAWSGSTRAARNVMRILASLEHYVLLGGDARAVLHQYMTGGTPPPWRRQVRLEVTTDYPWDGNVTIRLAGAPGRSVEAAAGAALG